MAHNRPRFLPLCFVFLFTLPLYARAYEIQLYYGQIDFSNPQTLKLQLHHTITNNHIPQPNQPDIVTDQQCDPKYCYKHTLLSYKKAREYLFGYLYLNGSHHADYSLLTSYCQTTITNNDVSASDPLAPMNIPDPKVINAEHTWPQSKFSKKFPSEIQKSDLHSLMPELSNINSQRNNHPFGIVEKITSSHCSGAALGKNNNNTTVFEPHENIKGNVARSLFYFSIRYQIEIDQEQEFVLRQWHTSDPIDALERQHNEEVFKIQKNRNPFIDMPEIADAINDF